ncbi:hypothetical protein DOY81_007857, partial [Sarcophaga bullata]
MCGIFCCISKTCKIHNCLKDDMLKNVLTNRGPDSCGIREIDNLVFGGFVLWQQGLEICNQPVESDTNLLVMNGDIYNVPTSDSNISDTKWLFEQLSSSSSERELINLFKSIEGPFSLIFYDKIKKTLFFGRDSLGRNSLIIEDSNTHLRLLSASCNTNNYNSFELPPLGIYKIYNGDIKNVFLFPWRSPDDEFFNHKEQLEKLFKININIRDNIEPDWLQGPAKSEKFNFNFYKIVDATVSSDELYDSLLRNEEVLKAINEFSVLLENSVKKRVQYTKDSCSSCLKDNVSCTHSKVAILFSGGIDCTILAILANKFVKKSDPIDLINVAFQRNILDNNWNVPDRISAKSSYLNLQTICPDRHWNLIEVVIVGSGADELFGGYVRHKNAYKRFTGTEAEKQQNLLRELEKDWSRIPSRNLARDDRVISDNGRSPRAPFVEEHVVKFVRSLKPYQRCCFLLGDGIGDKLFLRLFGYKLGLTSSAFLKKRAIQFGSRIANKKENAGDRSLFL